MNKFLRILLLSIFAFVALPSVAQPPPEDPKDILYAPQKWTVTNHTHCSLIDFELHNVVNSSNGDPTKDYWSTIKTYYIDYNPIGPYKTIQYELDNDPKNPTYTQILALRFRIWGLEFSYAYPNGSGETTILTNGNSAEPCSCFKVKFDATKKSIDIYDCNSDVNY